MFVFLAAAASAALTAALAPFFAYLGLITLGALRRRGEAAPAGAAAARLLVVIPAHDEEGCIERTVASCLAAEYPRGRVTVCVLADNCNDRTAALARAAGALVVERYDPARRGKGYALDDLFNSALPGVTTAGYDAVVVVDADSVVDPGALAAFAAALSEGGQWLQGYSTVVNPDDSRQTRLLTYAFSLVNGVWLLGQQALGMGVTLRGNGMCFATGALARVPWSAHGLAEDAEFSWDLRARGERPRFVPRAVIRSAMLPRFGPDAAAQRSRWEWGRIDVRRQFRAPLLRSANLPARLKALYLADLHFPAMVTLLLLFGLAMAPHLGSAVDPRWAMPRWLLGTHALMAAALGLYAVSPVLVLGLPVRYLLSLRNLPYYAAWKTGVVLGGRPVEWSRTRREHPRVASKPQAVAPGFGYGR